jgi:hypothetical protein
LRSRLARGRNGAIEISLSGHLAILHRGAREIEQ